ncbi:dilute domain-containing protein [Anaeramoeba flamelloides]|uniref:Dilute domain-containing protein n=1 Tax=Anaeramoeba flamelloides TaxID=1746091 RepID=A0AAV8A523_9EUKA|nr:dilute domain-containing protein [Anaeramoeba flamelloides]
MFRSKKISTLILFSIESIHGILQKNKNVYISWRIGRKKGKTKSKLLSSYGLCNWEEEFRVRFNLKLKDKKLKKKNNFQIDDFKTKKMHLKIHLEKGRSKKDPTLKIGKVVVDLSKTICQESHPCVRVYNAQIVSNKPNLPRPQLILVLRVYPNLKRRTKLPQLLSNKYVQEKIEAIEQKWRKTRKIIKNGHLYQEFKEKHVVIEKDITVLSETEDSNNSNYEFQKRKQKNKKRKKDKKHNDFSDSETDTNTKIHSRKTEVGEKEKEKRSKKNYLHFEGDSSGGELTKYKKKKKKRRPLFEFGSISSDLDQLNLESNQQKYQKTNSYLSENTENSKRKKNLFDEFLQPMENGNNNNNNNNNSNYHSKYQEWDLNKFEKESLFYLSSALPNIFPKEKDNIELQEHSNSERKDGSGSDSDPEMNDIELKLKVSSGIKNLLNSENGNGDNGAYGNKSKTNKEIIEEQQGLLKRQRADIKTAKKLLELSEKFNLAKFLFERLLFSKEQLFSGDLPVPACIIFRSFLHWKTFDPEQVEIAKIRRGRDLRFALTNTLELLLKINRYDINSLFWLMSNIIYLMKFIDVVLINNSNRDNILQINNSRDNFNKNESDDDDDDDDDENKNNENKRNNKREEQKEIIQTFKNNLNKFFYQTFFSVITNFSSKLKEDLIIVFLDKNRCIPGKKQINDKEGKKITMQPIYRKRNVFDIFNEMWTLPKRNYLPEELSTTLVKRMLHFISVYLFNELLQNKKFCTCGNGFRIKKMLNGIEEWCKNCDLEDSTKQLSLIKQASKCLILARNILSDAKNDYKICQSICPNILPHHLLKLLINRKQDSYDNEPLPKDLLIQFSNFVSKKFKNKKQRIEPSLFYPVRLNLEKINSDGWFKVGLPQDLRNKKQFAFLKENRKKNY